jgi:hypothetical protein
MLASDLILEVRASRSLSAAQVRQLERELMDGVDRHALELLFLLDRYARRADPGWPPLLARAIALCAEVEAQAAFPVAA